MSSITSLPAPRTPVTQDGSRHDAAVCTRITSSHARTFSLASRLLPAAKRRAANALYAFCRQADDLVDRQGADPVHLALELNDYRCRLGQALAGQPDDAVFRELMWAVHTYTLPTGPLFELLDGVGRDINHEPPKDWSEVTRYCEGVASSVGELCTHIFGTQPADSPNAAMQQAVRYARVLGVAMQLTNILRDVGEDSRHGRCYLPADELALFGLTPDDILCRPEKAAKSEGWVPFMQFQVARARSLYAAARPGIALLDADTQGCAVACADGYAAILKAIEHQNYNTFVQRATVGTVQRLRLLWLAFTHRTTGISRPVQPLLSAKDVIALRSQLAKR